MTLAMPFVPDADPPAPTLESVYTAYHAALSRYAAWLTRDPTGAADLVQEAFVRLAARWVAVREPRAYLFQLVTNLARREWRRQQQERALPSDRGLTADPADAVAIRAAVDRLPPKERQVVWLHYYLDLDVMDVARITGRPEGTVKSQLFGARRRLAYALRENSEQYPVTDP